MAGSWGTKVEAAFNQSPLLAGCLEELAEERVGAAGGGKHRVGGDVGCSQGAPSAWHPLGPRYPPPPPQRKGTVNALRCLAGTRAVPGSRQGSFNPLQEIPPQKKNNPPPLAPTSQRGAPTPPCTPGWGHRGWGQPQAGAAKGTGQRRVQGAGGGGGDRTGGGHRHSGVT